MGPRLISRGVVVLSYCSPRAVALQWGRGSLAAAWPVPTDMERRIIGFNGAAAH